WDQAAAEAAFALEFIISGGKRTSTLPLTEINVKAPLTRAAPATPWHCARRERFVRPRLWQAPARSTRESPPLFACPARAAQDRWPRAARAAVHPGFAPPRSPRESRIRPARDPAARAARQPGR